MMPATITRLCPCGGKYVCGKCERCGPKRDERRSSSERGYGSRWDAAKEAYLRKHPQCVCCLAQGVVNGERGRTGLRVDHIVPARMAPHLFWRRDNWNVICLDCDLRYKQPIERRCRTAEAIKEEWRKLLEEMRASCVV
jgi:5-methylcytosine-specific restriction endonuclease McrA